MNHHVSVLNSSLDLALVTVGDAVVVIRLGIRWFEADGVVVVPNGPLDIAQVIVGYAAVVVGIGIKWVEPDDFAIFSDGLLKKPLLKISASLGIRATTARRRHSQRRQ